MQEQEKVDCPTKQEFRKRILDLIKNQKEEDALRQDRVILGKFLALPVFRKAKTILFYASVKGEVNTFGMMEQALEFDKRVVLPVIQEKTRQIIPMMIRTMKELKPGTFGIPEPAVAMERAVTVDEIDLAVVPGVAFDQQLNRLGRGAGYYDRFLSELPAATPTIGLAYDVQVVERLFGLEAHDRPVTLVLTA